MIPSWSWIHVDTDKFVFFDTETLVDYEYMVRLWVSWNDTVAGVAVLECLWLHIAEW